MATERKKWYVTMEQLGLKDENALGYYLPDGSEPRWLPGKRGKRDWYRVFLWEDFNYSANKNSRVFECVPFREPQPHFFEGIWRCAKLRLVRELIPALCFIPQGEWNHGVDNPGSCNVGDYNTGDNNKGNYNTGNYNTGQGNTGSCNTGDYNAGHRNIGNRNTGTQNEGCWNTGDYNTGSHNTGDYNTGDRNVGENNKGDGNRGSYNTGDCNIGYFNTGDRNIGDYNKGTDHIGVFNTGKGVFMAFNKPCSRVVWQRAKKPADLLLLGTLGSDNKRWRETYRSSDEKQWKLLVNLPNFDPKVFQKISGILLDPETGREVRRNA